VCLPVLVVYGRHPGLLPTTGARHDGGTTGRQHSDTRRFPGLCALYDVTPDRLSPTTPARMRAIDTSFTVEAASPRKTMPTVAAPAAPIPVQTA
jgi:hypothetical protein